MWSALNHLKYFNSAVADHQPLLPECHPQRTACLLLLSSISLSLPHSLTTNSCALESDSFFRTCCFGNHLTQCDLSSYHLCALYAPNTYRPIDTVREGTWATLHMEMISINYHFPGEGRTARGRESETKVRTTGMFRWRDALNV